MIILGRPLDPQNYYVCHYSKCMDIAQVFPPKFRFGEEFYFKITEEFKQYLLSKGKEV